MKRFFAAVDAPCLDIVDSDAVFSDLRVSSQRGGIMNNSRLRTLIRNFAIEVLIYAALVVGYFALVLRLLGEPLRELFTNNLTLYGLAALALIVVQGVVLEFVTSFLVSRLGLERLD
jgi:hypothetical protein